MTEVWPLKFRELGSELLFTDDAGGFFLSGNQFLERYIKNDLIDSDHSFLLKNGHSFTDENDIYYSSFVYRWAKRLNKPGKLNYIILVPTLRCDLACSYCQVSRVSEAAKGFDWSESTLTRILEMISQIVVEAPTIEFQGGEPLLCLDVLERVRAYCRERFAAPRFIVCTNLQNVSEPAWAFLAASDTHISTSFDGTAALQTKHRTGSAGLTAQFLANVRRAKNAIDPERLSILPTLPLDQLPNPVDLVANYLELGIHSIFLRPVNYQGFARKRHNALDQAATWNNYHKLFIEYLIEFNVGRTEKVEEFYFSQCLRRVLRIEHNNHTDLRNPAIFGYDYLVVDYDGKLYPTDEARMISRLGEIDLSIGDVNVGIAKQKRSILNGNVWNMDDPDCRHCAYQPFCGLDPIDDISRYRRIDMPREKTDHCQKHLGIFDHIFELLYRNDEATRSSLAAWAGVSSLPHNITKRMP